MQENLEQISKRASPITEDEKLKISNALINIESLRDSYKYFIRFSICTLALGTLLFIDVNNFNKKYTNQLSHMSSYEQASFANDKVGQSAIFGSIILAAGIVTAGISFHERLEYNKKRKEFDEKYSHLPNIYKIE